jgi:hypothetical protein
MNLIIVNMTAGSVTYNCEPAQIVLIIGVITQPTSFLRMIMGRSKPRDMQVAMGSAV